MEQQRKRQTRVFTDDTGLQSVCSMDSSHKDVVLLTIAIVNNYVGRMKRKRKHCLHPLIVEKVLTYDTFAFSRDLSKNPNKFKEMCRVSKESFLEMGEYVRPFTSKKDTNYRNAIPVEERLLTFIN
jgi:hypothetical protein